MIRKTKDIREHITLILKCLIILVCIPFHISIAQTETEFKSSNFENKNGLKEAKQNYKIGSYHFLEKKYELAKEFLLKAYEFNPNNSDLNYKLGTCYLETYPKYKCLEFFKKAFLLKSSISQDIHYKMGQGYQLNYQFDKAIEEYSIFTNSLPLETTNNWQDKVSKNIQECKYSKELVLKPLNILIENIGSNINSAYPEYKPFISKDEKIMIFTSRRPSTTGKQRDPFDFKFYEDIYISYRDTINNTWQIPKSISANMNTLGHDAVSGLSAEGTKLIYYDGRTNGGDLYICESKRNSWSVPKSLPKNINSIYCESSGSFSKSTDTLYFISNNPINSLGGKDIYFTIYDSLSRTWKDPVNMGNTINTKFDEEAVVVHPDGKTIFFSSKGHQTMGGYDIFKTMKQPDGTWSNPINIGYPANTPDDDVFLVVAGHNRRGYYSTAREDTKGDQDIYLVTFLDVPEPVIKKDSIIQKDTIKKDTIIPSIPVIDTVVPLPKDTTPIIIPIAEVIEPIIEEKIEPENYSNNPIDVSIEIIDISQDPGLLSYYPTSNSNSFNFQLPSGGEYEVDVTLENHSTKRGKVRLIDFYKKNETLRSELLGDNYKNSIPTNNSNQLSTDLSKLYTIQIKALKNPVSTSSFKSLKNVRESLCEDGLYRYSVSEINGWQNALAERERIIQLGYKDAFIISVDDLENKSKGAEIQKFAATETEWTIHIASSKRKLNKNNFRLDEIYEFESEKGTYIYISGMFTKISDAKKHLSSLILNGFKDAYVIPVVELSKK